MDPNASQQPAAQCLRKQAKSKRKKRKEINKASTEKGKFSNIKVHNSLNKLKKTFIIL